jgi:hypothetical protein
MLELLQSFTLFGSVIGFYIAVLFLIGLLFYSDIEEEGYGAFFSFLIFCGVTYFWSNFNILSYFSWGLVGSYLGIGLLYSFIKTYFYARKNGEKGRKYIKENVFRWWFLWPVSLINWILSLPARLLVLFQECLKHFFDTLTESFSESIPLDVDSGTSFDFTEVTNLVNQSKSTFDTAVETVKSTTVVYTEIKSIEATFEKV